MPRYNDLEDRRIYLEQQRANLVEEERGGVSRQLREIDNELLTINALMATWEPMEPSVPPPPLVDSSYVPGSPIYPPGSPEGSLSGINDNYRGSPLGAYEEDEGMVGLYDDDNISYSNLDLSDSVIDVELTPPGSQNTTPPPVPTQTPSAPTRSRRSRRGGTKKRKGKKRKTMKKKSAKKGKKTKKR